MNKPMRECYHSSCRTLIPFDETYCDKHNHLKREKHKRYNQVRNREDHHLMRIYKSARWLNIRKQVLLRDDYLCVQCLQNNIAKPADVVDHIVELRDDISKAYDMDNLQSLCHACHNAKTLKEKYRRKSPSTFDGSDL